MSLLNPLNLPDTFALARPVGGLERGTVVRHVQTLKIRGIRTAILEPVEPNTHCAQIRIERPSRSDLVADEKT